MRYLPHFGSIGAMFLAGCATSSSMMMFGDSTTFGLKLGSDKAAGGGSVSIGYKAQSAAVIPLSVLADGKPKTLKAHDGNVDDAMSVFAVFDSAASTPSGQQDSNVRLGQVFSTGLAAQQLTKGYRCRGDNDANCLDAVSGQDANDAVAAANQAAAYATAAANAASAAAAQAASGRGGPPVTVASAAPGTSTAAPSDEPFQAPLIFLRSDTIGIDIGGSLASQGLQFSLGYNNQNLALIPVYAMGSDHAPVKIVGGVSSDIGRDTTDAMSVLGQFDAKTSTGRLDYGMDRYFSTGVAARNLARGIASEIASASQPAATAAANQPVNAPAPTASAVASAR